MIGKEYKDRNGTYLSGLKLILPWLLALLFVGGIAIFATSEVLLFSGLKKAVWVRLDICYDRQVPPNLKVVYNESKANALPAIWDIYNSKTWVMIRPLTSGKPVRLLSVKADKKPIGREKLNLFSKWERTPFSPDVTILNPEVIFFTGTYRNLDLMFKTGADFGDAEILWNGQKVHAVFSAHSEGEHEVHFTAPNIYYGWVLLPPQKIKKLTIHSEPGETPYTLKKVTIFTKEQQAWSDGKQIEGTGCRLLSGSDEMTVETLKGSSCDLNLSNLKTINVVSPFVRIAIWFVMTAAGMVMLWVLSLLADKARKFEAHYKYELRDSRLSTWLHSRTANWTMGKTALVVGVIAVAFHLTYAIFTPMWFSPDSTGYYAWARNLLHTHNFESINPFRTPGYPLIYAFTMSILGDQAIGLILLQHIALALLGPLVVWFLYPRVNPFLAALGGMLAGISPMITITASVIWTESLAASAGCLALLVFLRPHTLGWRTLLLAGIGAGIAAMIKPNLLVIVVLMVGCLVLKWWIDPFRTQLVGKMVRQSAFIVIGWLIVAMPWLIHIRSDTGEWDLTSVSDKTTVGKQPHMNIFKHAAYQLAIYQSPAPEKLQVNLPYHDVMSYSTINVNKRKDNLPARQAIIYDLVYYPLLWDDRFPMETIRENIRLNPLDYLDTFRVAFQYGFAHIEPSEKSPHLVYPELQVPLYHLTRPYPIKLPENFDFSKLLNSPTLTPEEVGPLMEYMTYLWMPPESPLRKILLMFTYATVKLWPLIAALAVGGLMVSLFFAPFRDFCLFGLYWIIIAAGPALIGVGAERYAVVVEPLFYVLMIPLFYKLLLVCFRKRLNNQEHRDS